VGWGIVAVATHDEAASTLVKLIPVFVFHTVTSFIGMVCLGLGYRQKKVA